MSTTLSYGYKLPDTGDRGATFFPDLEANIQQTNDHNHNGTNSAPLAIGAVVVTTQSILAAAWNSLGNGDYSQTVTLPGTLTYDGISMQFRITSSKDLIYPTITKASATSYVIFTNDNSIGVTAIYTT